MKLTRIFILFIIAFITIYLSYIKTDTETNVNSNKMKSTKMRSAITADTQFMTIDKDNGEISSVKLDISSLLPKQTQQSVKWNTLVFTEPAEPVKQTLSNLVKSFGFPENVKSFTIELVGGGGSGASPSMLAKAGAGGGGAGAYFKTTVTIDDDYLVSWTVGAGGIASSGSADYNGNIGNPTTFTVGDMTITVNGGGGGFIGNNTPLSPQPGSGGNGSESIIIVDPSKRINKNYISVAGGDGSSGTVGTYPDKGSLPAGGTGGASFFGSGGKGTAGQYSGASIDASKGKAWGSGGGGGAANLLSTTSKNGGNGASGVVIISWIS